MERNEYEEFLTPQELRETYGLEEDEDLMEFIRKINALSKGTKIRIIEESQSQSQGGDHDE